MGDAEQVTGVGRGVVVALAMLLVGTLAQCAQPMGDASAPQGASGSSGAAPGLPISSPAGPSAPPVATTLAAVQQRTVAPRPAPRPTPTTPAKPRPALWEVARVVDGDTIHVTRGGDLVKVRLIGIDSPERDECGFDASAASLRRIIGGREVRLLTGARTSQDQYGRLLRYVEVAGTDVGLAQIKSGYAVARFDSRDGYGGHTREAEYIAADRASPDRGWLCATPVPVRPQADWPLAGDEHPCPREQPIKGNESSMIAHSPGQQSYLVTNPEQCFATLSDAVAAGFRPAKR
ncbi:thermonuclease family protein [Intrasporangium calvum]|uniref:thermonuclease family protein n=1 Tax=Intrasporangium calvum TaxID=53358 RepID=UPI000DF60B9F|nr:thermonuclease family protein [Intrasporangium calvum]AXG14864.1 thermonuclease family protein [Intrasporangium calvum]